MKVLVACEESQAVCKAFRERGNEAYSCDIQHCALYDHLEWHIVEDARVIINGRCMFTDAMGGVHRIEGGWDLLIAHPPCTYLTTAGSVWLFDHQHRIRDFGRLKKGCDAREFFMDCLNAKAERKAIENPVPMKIWNLPPYTQIIEPYMFGDPWRKKTCLWLYNLPELRPTEIVTPTGLWVQTKAQRESDYENIGKKDSKMRSKTFPGIARAMAEQWG